MSYHQFPPMPSFTYPSLEEEQVRRTSTPYPAAAPRSPTLSPENISSLSGFDLLGLAPEHLLYTSDPLLNCPTRVTYSAPYDDIPVGTPTFPDHYSSSEKNSLAHLVHAASLVTDPRVTRSRKQPAPQTNNSSSSSDSSVVVVAAAPPPSAEVVDETSSSASSESVVGEQNGQQHHYEERGRKRNAPESPDPFAGSPINTMIKTHMIAIEPGVTAMLDAEEEWRSELERKLAEREGLEARCGQLREEEKDLELALAAVGEAIEGVRKVRMKYFKNGVKRVRRE